MPAPQRKGPYVGAMYEARNDVLDYPASLSLIAHLVTRQLGIHVQSVHSRELKSFIESAWNLRRSSSCCNETATSPHLHQLALHFHAA